MSKPYNFERSKYCVIDYKCRNITIEVRFYVNLKGEKYRYVWRI